MMEWWQSIILGIVEGITEFLPISSTGHLTVAEKLMGMPISDPTVTAYTAMIQVGAMIAARAVIVAIGPSARSAPRPAPPTPRTEIAGARTARAGRPGCRHGEARR